jgi:hypothetical protein
MLAFICTRQTRVITSPNQITDYFHTLDPMA